MSGKKISPWGVRIWKPVGCLFCIFIFLVIPFAPLLLPYTTESSHPLSQYVVVLSIWFNLAIRNKAQRLQSWSALRRNNFPNTSATVRVYRLIGIWLEMKTWSRTHALKRVPLILILGTTSIYLINIQIGIDILIRATRPKLLIQTRIYLSGRINRFVSKLSWTRTYLSIICRETGNDTRSKRRELFHESFVGVIKGRFHVQLITLWTITPPIPKKGRGLVFKRVRRYLNIHCHYDSVKKGLLLWLRFCWF